MICPMPCPVFPLIVWGGRQRVKNLTATGKVEFPIITLLRHSREMPAVMVECPYCHTNIRTDRLASHLYNKHANDLYAADKDIIDRYISGHLTMAYYQSNIMFGGEDNPSYKYFCYGCGGSLKDGSAARRHERENRDCKAIHIAKCKALSELATEAKAKADAKAAKEAEEAAKAAAKAAAEASAAAKAAENSALVIQLRAELSKKNAELTKKDAMLKKLKMIKAMENDIMGKAMEKYGEEMAQSIMDTYDGIYQMLRDNYDDYDDKDKLTQLVEDRYV